MEAIQNMRDSSDSNIISAHLAMEILKSGIFE